MSARAPLTELGTHQVLNQVPPLEDYNLFDADPALVEAVRREGAGWAEAELRAFGALMGSERVQRLGVEANRFKPELKIFDRYGQRVDEVEYHPAYHELMRLAVEHGMPSLPWREPRPGAHVAHSVMLYLLSQVEAGVCCPLTMTYAVVPALRRQPEVAAEWEPKVTARSYDPRCVPVAEKSGATFGMAMTEKQGGSDVRANATRAEPVGDGAYRLVGHKWFLSAPMCDAFLVLAQAPGGLTCFFLPRWTPDGVLNALRIQRLKDKVGNRSNASAEVEFQDALAWPLGEEGRGVPTIIEMATHTRLDCALGTAGLMRRALAEAIHHAEHRNSFGRHLADHPLMRNVLADLALEYEAAVALCLRLARAFDAGEDAAEAAFRRVVTPAAKYWVCKRGPGFAAEAMEVLGGSGYVEEAPLGRLYREMPVNSIWEGSGNIMCLDVLRALARTPAVLEVVMAELRPAIGANPRFDTSLGQLEARLSAGVAEEEARSVVQSLVQVLQASLLLRFAPAAVADAFCASRLVEGGTQGAFGTLPAGLAVGEILARARPG